MRQFVLVAAAALFAGCGSSQASNTSSDEGGATDEQWSETAENWQGTWRLVSYTENGHVNYADAEWVVEDDRYWIRLNGSSGQGEPYPYRLDPRNSRIDVHHHDTPPGSYGGHFKGIYEIHGDSLKVCYDLMGQQYPDSFEAGPGSKRILYELKRQGY